jgi:DNA mismatch endonuclease (patch repair protein)
VLNGAARTLPDVFTKEKRSEIMSKIKPKGTKIELKMKTSLEKNGIDFEYQPKLYGRPDFLIPPNVVIFCDSSFWHGRHWNKLRKQLSGYWLAHIKKNRKRDIVVNKVLRREGYIILRFWDTQINADIEKCMSKVKQTINASNK